MTLTKHAQERVNQRGLTQTFINLVLEHGSLEYAPGGIYRLVLRRRDRQEIVSQLKQMLRAVEQARDGVLVLNEQAVITAYKRH